MTTPVLKEARTCRLCGYVGLDVSPAVYQTKAGKFVPIAKCDDHAACQARRPR